jgi:hypothetical protein
MGSSTAEASASASQTASTSKCPFAGIASTTKSLFKGNGAAAPALESPPTQSFTAKKFDYTPFSNSSYQVPDFMQADPDWLEIACAC